MIRWLVEARKRVIKWLIGAWRYGTTLARALMVVSAAIGLAGVGFGANAIVTVLTDHTCVNQGATLLVHEGARDECIGFTDGSYVFDPSLAGVEHDIAQEDQQVIAAHPNDYVSIVYLLPISSAGDSILSMTNALEELRGAYAEQYYANHKNGSAPYIQLLIGNDGYQANQWQPAAEFIQNAVPTQHVAAVAGLGVSLDTTQQAAEQLTRAGIPVIGATLTSDTFDNIQNMIRVSPPNKDGISVAVTYIRSIYARAVLVEDENGQDTYDATLVNGFEKFPDTTHQIVGKETYDTTSRDQGQPGAEDQIKTRIDQMPADICIAQPAAVLFGGRGEDLATLVGDLANRPCSDKPITIISGDDVTNMPISPAIRQGLASGVTVDYSGIAHPDEWSTGTGAATYPKYQGFLAFQNAFDPLFPGATLTDGNTMMAYGATVTSVSVIRLTSVPQPTPDAVSNLLGALQGGHEVLGASGPLAFTADYRTSTVGSNPVGKPIPILRLALDGSSQFVQLYWPAGLPPSS